MATPVATSRLAMRRRDRRIAATEHVVLLGLVPNPLVIPVGVLIGVLIALPIGPINLLALQRAAERGFFGGLAAGIGVTLGDAMIATVATFGVKALSGAVAHYRWAIQIVGGAALIGSGAKLFLSRDTFRSVHDAESATLADYAWDIPKLMLLTITNPGAVLSLIAIFGGASSFVEVDSRVDAMAMVLAIMSGSFLYWLVASNLINGLRHRLTPDGMRQINRVAGVILACFGSLLIGEFLWKRL
jgi:threonine/homoserine/homoserine lactone efflux protein